MQASGRAAIAVAWGPWGGAGMAAADPGLAARLTRQGEPLIRMCGLIHRAAGAEEPAAPTQDTNAWLLPTRPC